MSTLNAITSGAGGVALSGDTSGNLTIQSAGTNVASFLTTGNLQFNASNGGIIFNKSGGLTNSTLNDYEEGTWTPTDASGAGLSLTIRQATYVKVGKAVFVYMFVVYPSTANGSTAKIGGLPFSASSLTQTNYQLTGRNQTGGTAYNGQVSDSATAIDPVPLNSFSTGPANSVLSTYGIIFSGYYLANA